MGFYRRRSGLTVACGLLALGGIASTSAPAWSATDTPSSSVNIDVEKADFHAVVSMLEKQAGVDVTVREGDQPFKPVTVHLENASLEKALKKIAFSAHAKFSKDPEGGYLFEPESGSADSAPPSADGGAFNAVTPSPVPNAPPQVVDSRPEARYPAGSLHWQSIVLQHAVPNEVLKMMQWDRDLVEMDPFKPLQMSSPRANISSSQPNIILPGAMPNYPNGNYPNGNYQNGGDPSVPLGTGNGGPASANYSAHRSADPASPQQANQFPGGFNGGGFNGGGFNGGGFNGGGFNGGGFNGGGFNGNGNGGIPGNGNNQQRQGALPEGVVRIFALQSNNSLLLQATTEGYQTVREIIRHLDIAPRQVQIKVEFVTASVTDVDNLGINFDLVPYPGLEFGTQQGNSTIVNGVGPTFLQYATGNIVAQLFQTLTRTRGKVVQAPLITTTNNVTAQISVNTQIPFFTSSTVSTGGLNNNTFQNQQANFLQLQTGLTITPRINSDDSVTMNLTPQITDTTGQAAVGGIPPTVTQTLNTLRTVRSGDTMVLGGLVRKQETASTQRIPILSDIPILGGLFRTRNKQINDQELLIFVTPTIIGESNDSATANANGGQSVTITP